MFNLLSCAAIEAFIPRAIDDKKCVVDLIFSDFSCGGLAIFDFFCNEGLSACLTFWWIPLGASSSACLSAAPSHSDQCHQIYWNLQICFHNRRHYHAFPERCLKKFLFINEVSAALDTKFNGLWVSAKTGFKIWYQWGSFSVSSPEPFFAWFVLFAHSVLNHLHFCRCFDRYIQFCLCAFKIIVISRLEILCFHRCWCFQID